MNLFPDDFHTIGGLSALGEDLPSIPEVARWFTEIPGADPLADRAKLEYYQKAGRAQLVKDVAAGGYGADPNRNLPSLETVNQWFQMTPGANPRPSIDDLNYYRTKSQAQLAADVAAVRAANPAIAAQIDALRKELQLPPFTVADIQAKRAQVQKWFEQIPGADPYPDPAALDYYAEAGYDRLVADVAAVRASNPSAAMRADELRARLGLPMVANPTWPPKKTEVVTVTPPTLTPPPSEKPEVVAECRPGYFQPDRYDPTCIPMPDMPRLDLEPIYTKQYPYPTAESDIRGFLFDPTYGETDIPTYNPNSPFIRTRPFNLKKGDPIPINWQAEQPMTSPGEPARPTTPAAAGTGALLLAAIAAYLIGG